MLVPALTAAGLALASVASDPVQAFTISDSRIAESSGLALSPTHKSVMWTHNDSGDSSRVFALGAEGQTLGVWRLDVVPARDWETMAATKDSRGRGVLWVGDIGDNGAARTNGILVHRAIEPADPDGGGTLRATSYRLRYADGPHDAEAMFFGADGRLRIVTKALFGGSVFVAPERLDPDAPNVLEREGDAPGIVTDATALPGGRYAVRDYSDAYVYDADGELQARVALPSQPQGESLTSSLDGTVLYAGSEGEGQPVWRVPLPESVRPEPAGSAAPRPSADAAAASAAGTDERSPRWPYLAIGLGVAGLLVLGVGRALRRR
ncbi:hypothetical protein [Motilibacter deserti]|uniref:WD40 repeat domain-containing protein n=1 Tax=Motilibacter deserti TaxID=2714956 RepID=A0ABX0GUY2_9ACTN|nr:hypothetical protein [Motilibacter deserti]NHC14587.1 hypothetical protein [Motilibacter deserti]